MHIDYDVDGIDEAITIGVRANKQYSEELREILREAAVLALDYMRKHVPRSGTGYANRHTGTSAMEHSVHDSLAMTKVSYRPGGAGGGGFYEIEVGAIFDPPRHLEFMFEGTRGYPFNIITARRARGLRQTKGTLAAGKGRKAVGNVGKIMVIWKQGEPVKFRPFRKGQRAQQAWFTEAYRHAQAYLHARIQAFHLSLDK
jgi:hypothetical protein